MLGWKPHGLANPQHAGGGGGGGGRGEVGVGVNTWMLFLSGQSLSVHTTMHVPAAV